MEDNKSSTEWNFDENLKLNEEKCRNSFLRSRRQKCLWSSSVFKNLRITKISYSTAYYYSMETFCERRSFSLEQKPFNGTCIHNEDCYEPPDQCQVVLHPKQMFKEYNCKVEVFDSAQVHLCSLCSGKGVKMCSRCSGRGQNYCKICEGNGQKLSNGASYEGFIYQPCWWCDTAGYRKCKQCRGNGSLFCEECEGSCWLKIYLALNIKFENEMFEFMFENDKICEIPIENARLAVGITIFDESYPELTSYPCNLAPKYKCRLAFEMEKWHKKHVSYRVWQQRHLMRQFPLIKVQYEWKNRAEFFWIYGLNEQVYCPHDHWSPCCLL